MTPIELIVKDITEKKTADGIKSKVILKGSTEELDIALKLTGTKRGIATLVEKFKLENVGYAGIQITMDQMQTSLENFEEKQKETKKARKKKSE